MKFEYHVEGGDFLNAGNASGNIKKVLKKLNVDSINIAEAIPKVAVTIIGDIAFGIICLNII